MALQFYARLPVLAALKDRLAAMPMTPVFDHFAGAKAALGVNQPGFDIVLELVRSGKAYVKISGAYRASDAAPDYANVAPLARALIAANADHIVWGSDWPHPGPPGKSPTDINTPFPVVKKGGRTLWRMGARGGAYRADFGTTIRRACF